jgi:replicative DNA helicase
MKAPYHRAKTPVGALVGQTVTPLVKQDWGRAIKRVRDRNSGVERTGLLWRTAGLDHYTRLRQGEFIIVGARPSMGKTGFLVDAALNIAESGTPVMVFSAETGEVALSDRFLARATGIDSKRLRGEGSPLSPDDERCLAEAANALDALPLYVNYAASNAEQILALVERAVLGSRIPLDADFVVFMDYLQFGNTVDVTNSGEKEYTRVTRVSSEFKAVSMILNRPFVAFSQLNRDGEDEEEPTLALLRATGQLEQDANVVMILSGTRTPGPISRRNLFLLKDKEGEAGHVIDLVYHQAICHFEPTANLKNSDPASTAIPSLLDGVL